MHKLLYPFFLALILSGLSNSAIGQQIKKYSSSLCTDNINSKTKFQLIYKPADFGNPSAANPVSHIYFRYSNAGQVSRTITNFEVKLGSVSADTFPGLNRRDFFTNLTSVFKSATYSTPTGNSTGNWRIPIDELFYYQPNKTLVVEVSYTSINGNLVLVCGGGTNPPNHKRLNANGPTNSPDGAWLDFGLDLNNSGSNPPGNDLCFNATPITLNTACQQLFGTTVGALQSLPPGFCSGFSSTAAKDVFYSFTANSATDSFFVQGLGGFDPVLQLYSGLCGSPSGVQCAYTPGADNKEVIAPGNLVPGQNYFLRIYGMDGVDGSFLLCGKSSNLIPQANDECSNAISLYVSTVNTGTTGTTAGATQSLPAISCNGNTSPTANDVWYKFVALNAYDSVSVRSNGFMNPVVELYSGTCANLSTISCSDRGGLSSWERVASGDLIPGNTYYVRVYGFGITTGSFTINAKTPPPATPIANDDCFGAILLTSSPAYNCISQQFSNLGATQTNNPSSCLPAGLSAGAGAADVWFMFNSNAYDTIIVSPIGDFNPVVELNNMGCNPAGTMACSNGLDPQAIEKISTGSANSGTYYVRVYGFNGTVGSFTICLKRGDPSVLYDNCTDAPNINVVSPTCSPVIGRTTNATPTAGLANCKGNADDDVWYKFNPFGQMTVALRLSCDPGFDGAMEIFSGSCTGGLTPLACINRMGAGVQEDTALFVPNDNTVYFVRIYHAGVGAGTGGFSLCISQALIPTNDNCSNRTFLTFGENICSSVFGTTYRASQNNAPVNCAGQTSPVANEVWYQFSALATIPFVEISVRPEGGMDPVIEVFRSCSDSSVVCKDDSGAGKGETLVFANNCPFASCDWVVRIYSNSRSAAFGDFRICVKAGAAPCTTQAGVATTSATSIVNNGRVVLGLNGQTPGSNVQWQVSYNNGASYANFGPSDPVLPDTLTLVTSGTQNVLVRAVVKSGTCTAATTSFRTIEVKCATTFTQPIAASAGKYISNFTLHTINQSSTPLWRNGSYEQFTTTTSLCKGVSYPLSITHAPENASLTRVMWMDLNNDGDFSDANELILPPNTGSGILSQQIVVPVSATATGNIRVRVMVYDAGNATPENNPCFAGPYASGEIEEYTVNLSNPIAASAGPDKTICIGNTNLSGSSPLPGTGLWSVVSGPGVVVTPTNQSSLVNNLGILPTTLVWQVTNGPCVNRDTVVLQREADNLNIGNDTVICEDDTLELSAGTGYNSYLWWNGNSVPSVRILNPGTYWVRVTSSNGCVFSDTIEVDLCTGLARNSKNQLNPVVYPNPSKGEFNIKADFVGSHKVFVFNHLGKLIQEKIFTVEESLKTMTILLENKIPGVYWLEVQNQKDRIVWKVLVE